jgi:hypothetical protein
VRVKVRRRPGQAGASPPGERDLSPEHDDVAQAASVLRISLREAERRAIAAALSAPADSGQGAPSSSRS